MLPADLVDRLDARAADPAMRGAARTRDEIIATAVDRWLSESSVSASTGVGRALDPSAVEGLARRAREDIDRLAADIGAASSRRGRAIDDLAAQLRHAAMACDRDGFLPLGERLAAVQTLLRSGVDDALAELAALVQQATALLVSSLPVLPADARSRWLSAQAGRGLAPDRIVRGANALDLALGVQTRLRAAAAEAEESVKRSRATIERHADPHGIDPGELRVDDDVDAETWSFAAQAAAASVARTLETQRAVIDVGLDHALVVARTSLEIVGAHAREMAEHLAHVPDVASAC
jgi:hypothetical protein